MTVTAVTELEPVTTDTATDIVLRTVKERSLGHVVVAYCDTNGIMRGKLLPADRLAAALRDGYTGPAASLGFDPSCTLLPGLAISTGEDGYADQAIRIDPATLRDLPWDSVDKGVLLLADFAPPTDAITSRGVLRRVLARGEAMGFAAFAGVEFEFTLFDETPASAQAKRYADLQPAGTGLGYQSVLRHLGTEGTSDGLMALCSSTGLTLDALHLELSPGQWEASLRFDAALAAADKAFVFKTYAKIWAQQRRQTACFMAKWSNELPGQAGHLHVSLRAASDGHAVFHDPREPRGISPTFRHFIGGQQRLLPELLLMLAPNENSFKRLNNAAWCPDHADWGIEDRTAALRVVTGAPQTYRLENRAGGADINPYVALAAAIGAGLYGIAHRIEPGAPAAKGATQGAPRLPRTLEHAVMRLRGSAAARELFGDAFVDFWSDTRERQAAELGRTVTDWELRKLFEMV